MREDLPRLSEAQRSAMLTGSDFFLKACPGAGKTRSVAARAASLVEQGQHLALLSYTRVGAREIADAVVRDFGVPLGDAHFVGTLHSFLVRYVLRPFGHLVTGSALPMGIDNEAMIAAMPPGLKAEDFQYNTRGTLVRVRGLQTSPDELDLVGRARRSLARSGVVGFTDAVSISLQVLLSFPDVARALTQRFDEILVDEAQDTSDLLLQSLRAIKDAGLRSLVLVGDYDQAIYQFNGSLPEGCEKLARDVGLETRELRENFRSSQLICNMTAVVRGDSTPDVAAGPDRDVTIRPTLVKYAPGTHSDLPARFLEILTAHGISASNAAILVRNRDFAAQLEGIVRPAVPSTFSELMSAASTVTPSMETFQGLEDLIVRRTFGNSSRPAGLDRMLVRTAAVQLLRSLPALRGDLHDWGMSAIVELDRVAKALSPVTTSKLAPINPPAHWKGTPADYFIARAPNRLEITTIHGAKGRSIDAVMLVAQVPAESFHTPNATAWSEAIANPSAPKVEELRLGYVALTRAKRLAVLAIPNDTRQQVVDRWLRAGFVSAD